MTRLDPSVRLIVGIILVAAIIVLDPASWIGLGLTLVCCGLLGLLVRPCVRPLLRLLLTGIALIGPFALFLPWVEAGAVEGCVIASPAACVGMRILFRGLGVMVVVGMTAASIKPEEHHDALVRLPLPLLVTSVLGAILHQTRLMAAETQRLVDVLTIRGATGRGRAWWLVLKGLPSVWLPRMLAKGRRIGDAMEVRGFDGAPTTLREQALGPRDVSSLVASVAWLLLAILSRWGIP